MASPKTNDDLTPEQLARFAAQFRRRAVDFTVKAKATKDAAEKVMFTRSAASADVLASHFERALAEVFNEKAVA